MITMELSVSKIKTVFETAEKFMGQSNLETYFNYAYIDCSGDKMSVVTTNGDFSFKSTFETEKISKEGEVKNFLLPLKSFMVLIKKIPQDMFTLKADVKSIKISGKKFKYSLPININEGYVHLEPNKLQSSVKLAGKDLGVALDKVMHCASKEGVGSSYLKSVYLKMDSDVTDIVSADGTRLAYKVMDNKNFIKSDKDIDVMIPLPTVENIIPLLTGYDGDVDVNIYDNILQFILSNGYEISARKVDGTYPDYKKIITLDMNEYEIIVNTKEFLGALSRISNIAEQRIVSIKVENNQMVLNGKKSDKGEGEEYIDIINNQKFSKEFMVSAPYILEGVNHINSDEMVIRLSETASKPMAVKEFNGDNNYIFAVMMVRQG